MILELEEDKMRIDASGHSNEGLFNRVDKKTEQEHSVFYAGNTTMKNGLIDERREFGRNQALQVIKDIFAADRKIDEHILSHKDKIEKLKAETSELTANIKDVDARQVKLLEESGIRPGDKEYEDLMLLNKQRIYKKYGFDEEDMKPFFSEDELKQLETLNMEGLTDFQKASMENQEAREFYSKQLNETQRAIENSYRTVDSIKQQRLKTHPMVDAKEAADKIIALTEKNIKGMLINEGIEKIEEEKKENQEKIEQAREAKEEDEEIELEDLGGSASVKRKNIQGNIQDAVLDVDQVQVSIGKIIDDMQLMTEDLKGLVVDKNL